MKAKDKQRKDALSMLLSALKNFEIDKKDHEPITEDEANTVVKKEIKQSQDCLLYTSFFQTADLGLADVNLLGYLSLGLSLEEAHVDNVAFPFGKAFHGFI